MNAPVRCLVRCTLLWAGLAAALPAVAQDRSLTEDFPKMSAKERSRIAAKEAEEAAADRTYQAHMLEADKAFQEKRYEDALAAYEKARELRPYNVYPKVKIEDLRALLRREGRKDTLAAAPPVPAAVPQAAPVPAETPVSAPTPPAKPIVVKPEPSAPAPVPAEVPAPTKPAPATAKPEPEPRATRPAPVKPGPSSTGRPAPERATAKPAAPVTPPSTTAPPPPLGTGERTYKEGNAMVLERTVDDEGQRVVYKRVSHPWGQVFYFKDGLSVGERVWKQRFSE